MLIRTFSFGSRVGTTSSFLSWLEYVFPLRTWNLSTSCRASLFFFKKSTTRGGSFAKASLVGAKTVKGPTNKKIHNILLYIHNIWPCEKDQDQKRTQPIIGNTYHIAWYTQYLTLWKGSGSEKDSAYYCFSSKRFLTMRWFIKGVHMYNV